MRTAVLTAVAVLAAAVGAFGAQRALRSAPVAPPALTMDAASPLFALENLRHGDRAERCITVTNDGGGAATISIRGEGQGGDLAEHLRLVVTRGCGEGTILVSGPLSAFVAAGDEEPLAPGDARRFGLAVEVAGTDAQVQGRRAVHAFVLSAEGRGGATARADSAAPTCRTIVFAAAARRRRRPAFVRWQRVDARVTAKLILRIRGQKTLTLQTGLRARGKVLAARDFGRVVYRLGDGASLSARRRPFRVRIAAGALKPGRNVLRVAVIPRRGRAVRAQFALRVVRGATTSCELA